MSDKIYTIDEIRNIIVPIATQYGVQSVYLFGSYARGEATAASDLDLRIEKGKVLDFFTLGEMYCDLEEKFNKKLDLLTTGSLDNEFLSRIADEEIMIYAG